jgi:hypothetical protein
VRTEVHPVRAARQEVIQKPEPSQHFYQWVSDWLQLQHWLRLHLDRLQLRLRIQLRLQHLLRLRLWMWLRF